MTATRPTNPESAQAKNNPTADALGDLFKRIANATRSYRRVAKSAGLRMHDDHQTHAFGGSGGDCTVILKSDRNTVVAVYRLRSGAMRREFLCQVK